MCLFSLSDIRTTRASKGAAWKCPFQRDISPVASLGFTTIFWDLTRKSRSNLSEKLWIRSILFCFFKRFRNIYIYTYNEMSWWSQFSTLEIIWDSYLTDTHSLNVILHNILSNFMNKTASWHGTFHLWHHIGTQKVPDFRTFWIRDNQPVQCQPKDFNKQVQFVIFQPRV